MATIDERIEALTQSVELLLHDTQAQGDNIQKLLVMAQQDGENIRGLARIAEAHEHRIGRLEGREE